MGGSGSTQARGIAGRQEAEAHAFLLCSPESVLVTLAHPAHDWVHTPWACMRARALCRVRACVPAHLERARESIQQHALACSLPQVRRQVAQEHGRVGADGGLLVHLHTEGCMEACPCSHAQACSCILMYGSHTCEPHTYKSHTYGSHTYGSHEYSVRMPRHAQPLASAHLHVRL